MFDVSFFEGNRNTLAEKMPNSLIIIPANILMQSTADQTFPFRQDSNFWYLTGINEPDLILVIDTNSDNSIIYSPQQSDYHKQWDGELNISEMQRISGVTTYFPRSDLGKMLLGAKKKRQKLCYVFPLPEIVEPYGFYSNPARRILESEIKKVKVNTKDIRLDIARLRQIKQPCELAEMQKAIDVTGKTLKEVKKKLISYNTEADLARDITVGFYMHGAEGHGYQPIVASGKNAAIIHYIKNDEKLKKGELVLLDVGATVGYYSADISRTWCVGKPNKRQKQVFDEVLKLQNLAFSILKPGILLQDYQKIMEAHAAQAMERLGVKKSKYPHGFSHFIGLDVHDSGDYKSPLKENSVITVEPGIYLPEESIGVRIEDIVRITKGDVEILSKNIPRTM